MFTRPRLQAQRLFGKIAVVTGGASGIGKAICVQLAREGAKVVVLDQQRAPREGGLDVITLIRAARLEEGLEAKSSCGNYGVENVDQFCKFVEGDVLDRGAIVAAISAAKSLTSEEGVTGRLDILVNNAARLSGGHNLLETTSEEWDTFMNVNVKGAFLCSQEAVRVFLHQEPQGPDSVRGRIVNVVSQHGKVAAPSNIAYGCSKAALDYMTKQVAVDYIQHGIVVNAVAPGRVLTGRPGSRRRPNGEAYENGEFPPDEAQDLIASETRTPHAGLGRLGTPHDIAKAVAFLASDCASFIVGETLAVDGGYLAC